jgi:hypothetical protein
MSLSAYISMPLNHLSVRRRVKLQLSSDIPETVIMNKIFTLILLLIIAGSAVSVGQSKVATSAAPFLAMPIGARAIGMGSANVAISADALSAYYNPGAISMLGYSQALASHTWWLVGTKFDWVGVVINLDGANAVSVNFTQLDYGEDIVTTDYQQNGTGEKWAASDLAIALSYARNLTDRFAIGGSAKYIQQKIWNSSASAFGVDVGLLYNTGFNGLKIGMSISNFGSDMRMDGKDLFQAIDLDPANLGDNNKLITRMKTDDWPLPLLFRAGVSMDAMKTDELRLTVAADALRPSDNGESINVGGELGYKEMLFLRAGKRQLFLDNHMEEYSFGGGILY